MNKIIETDILSEGRQKLRITLANGEVIEGYSLGMITAVDEYGEELDYDVIAFVTEDEKMYYRLKNDDIKEVKKA